MSHIFVVIGPSGVGKGTLVNKLLKEFPNLAIPASYTTRPPRAIESNKKIYHFVSEEEFMQANETGKILEFERTHGFLYGTDKESINEALKQNKTVIAEIDFRGAQTYKKHFKEKVKTIFISVDSLEMLRQRFVHDPSRENMSKEEIVRRLETAAKEMQYIDKADFVIKNNDGEVDKAYQELKEIVLGN